MIGAAANVYATWFINPNQERISVRLFGVGKSLMAFVYFSVGFTESGVIVNPAKSTVCCANTNFSRFKTIP